MVKSPNVSEGRIHRVVFGSGVMIGLFLGILGYMPLWGQDLNFAPVKPDGPAKIQSALWELAVPSAGKLARAEGVEDTVVVILVPQRGQGSASIDTSSMAALGVEVKARSKSLMRVSVPASSLLAVSELPGVSFVRRPFRPHAQQTRSEGRRLVNAYDNYNAGVRGQGVKVAVIDLGFKGADELSRDMPARWWSYDYTDEGMYAGENIHGTACAEIIYDMAPEAELYLYKVGDLVDLENAKDRCIREGIDVINHSLYWHGFGIGDGKGMVCDIVNDAADQGILWVNAAGNSANSHYSGVWSDSDADGWQNFSGPYEVIAFEAKKGEEIRVFLTWDDWPISLADYDLYLEFVNSAGELESVAESTDYHRGLSGRDPVERIEVKAERSGKYGISVWSVEARPIKLKIWSPNHDFEDDAVAENSIESPADARGAMSVGAVHFDEYDLGRIADYSSRGPTFDGRIKPELVAPSGVSTTSKALAEFSGTSAAAPHVAGAAALIKSANPSYSRDDLWDALVEATVDIGPRGIDNDSGYGKLVLPIIPQELPSRELLGYSPPAVTRNLTRAKFGFEGSNRDLYCYFSIKEVVTGEVDIFFNEQRFIGVPAGRDWKRWYIRLYGSSLRSGRNTIEFRNTFNQERSEFFAHWQLKDVHVTSRRPANAKPVPGTQLPSELPEGLVSGLGDPFPTPFNASVTVPFAVADAGLVRISVYNLMGQSIRVLADGWVEAGLHQVRWDGRTAAGAEAASGVYWAVLQAGEAVQTAKLALIR